MSLNNKMNRNIIVENLSQTATNLTAPLGEGLDWKIFPSRVNALLEQRSVYMESPIVNSTLRTFGMPSTSSSPFVHLPADDKVGILLVISSTDASDTQIANIKGLDYDWNQFTVSVTLNGQNEVSIPLPSSNKNWIRINKIWLENTSGGVGDDGAFDVNDGDIYVYTTGRTSVTNGKPSDKILSTVNATFMNSTMGIYSVGKNRNFHYMRGNTYTDATASKPLTIQELGYFNWNEAGDGTGQRNVYQVGTYGVSGNVSYGFQAAAGWGSYSDIELRIRNSTGTNRCVLYYEYALTDALVDSSNSQTAPIQDT